MVSRKFALIIGNSEYEDKSLAELLKPSADAKALAEIIRDPEIGGFDEVTVLVDQPATTIRRAVSSFFTRRGREDLLLLYFSGHGIRDDRGQLFLAVKDTEHNLLRGTAIPAAFITDEMDNSRSRRQVLILDCCHSGAFSRGMKGAPGTSVGTATAFEGTGSGRVVLTATDSTQYAWEGDRMIGQAENSVFTHYLIQGLRTGEADTDADGRITLDELYDYVYERVVDETPRQTPGKWSYGQQGDIIIARNPSPVLKPAALPPDLQQTIDDPRPWVREGAVNELDRIFHSSHPGLALAAHEALKRMAGDDSRRVARAAAQALASYEEVKSALEDTKTAVTGQESEKPATLETDKESHEPEKAEVESKGEEKEELPKREHAEQELPIHERPAVERVEQQRLILKEKEDEQLAAHQVEAERVANEKSLQEQPSLEKMEVQTPRLRKLTGALPKWAIWVGLLFVGVLIVSVLEYRQANRGGVENPTAILTAKATFSPTEEFSFNATSAQPTTSSPSSVLLTNTPPPPISTVEPTKAIVQSAEATGRIAFESKRDGNYEIYVMNGDGSEQTRLTNNQWDDFNPAWSPDGMRIAFSSERDGNWDIYVMNSDGSEQTRLTNNPANDQVPAWSPDGTRIAFASQRDDNYEIYVMNADSSGQTRLTNNQGADFHPAWSTDGTHIAFESEVDGNREIYVMNADGSGQTRLTNNSVRDWFPAWSPPDDRYIAFELQRDGNWEIYVMNADGSGQTQLTNNQADDSSPTWQQ